MAWPEDPRSLGDLPFSQVEGEVARELIPTFETPAPGTETAICHFAKWNRDKLEAITQGDPEQEARLANVLFLSGYLVATSAVPDELKTIRYKEHGIDY